MRTTTPAILAALIAIAGAAHWVPAQDRPLAPVIPALPGDTPPTPIPGVNDKFAPAKPAAQLLGDPFESQIAGVVFRPPAGSKMIRPTDPEHNADAVVDYVDEGRQWLLKVTRAKLAQAMPLQTVKDGVRPRTGLLDYTVQDIVKNNPAAEILRQDIVNVGDYGVGVAALRFNVGTQRYLRQQAMFQASEQLYYIFNLTTPAARDGKAEDNPDERLAVETFKAMIDTIQLLDRAWIRADQDNRLYRTRALFTDWIDKGGRRIREAAVPEQWLRITRDGKDIGYSYVVEEFTAGKDVKANPGRAFDGILISVRSRTVENGNQIDTGSQLFTSLDRKHEDWAHVINVVNNKGKPNEEKKQQSEYGFSELRLSRVVDRDAPRDPNDPKAPPGHDVETYKLSVSRPDRTKPWAAGTVAPDYKTPSPFYIPQAVGTMLPRLLPLNRPVTYLFQSYVSDQRECILRYVDVGFEREAKIGGRTVRAIGISDRIRLEGDPTVHYMSPDGKYLGSINETAKIAILPTDKQTLEKIWENADLTKPENIQPASAQGKN